MAAMDWERRLRRTSLLSVLIMVLVSPTVQANPVVNPLWGLILIVPINLPFNTMLLLACYWLFADYSGPRSRYGRGRFFELFVYSTLIITFSGALIDGIAFAFESQVLLLICAVLIGVVVFWVCVGILGMSRIWGVVTAFFYFVVNMVIWMVMIHIVDWLLVDAWPVFLLMYVVLLGLAWKLADRFHFIEEEVDEESVDAGALTTLYRVDRRQAAMELTDGTVTMCRITSFSLLLVLIMASVPF